ncbi:plasmid mobilization protein [Vallitalea longa]|uniref:plasmid mobilization protein n=1 Tax=Vallitalea longa TaxID=2936439 RepID=UPI002493C361|nr:plasmid mobilization relaxosome protein MobC [Vallitalea longa]
MQKDVISIKKDTQFKFRISSKDLEIIRSKSAKANMSVSAYIISSALKKDIIIINGIQEFTRQLSKVGNNLNQLTILCHQGRITNPNLSAINKLLQDIYKYLINIRQENNRNRR